MLPEATPMTERQRLALEKKIFGLYVSGYPMSEYREVLDRFDLAFSDSLSGYRA
jgi:DNA polymerase III alpha subunit